MFPQQTVEELLSLAHVQAIAGQAGVSMSYFDLDYGFDGTYGELSTNSKTVRIRIARNQLFLPESLQWMLNNVDIGIWP